MLLKLYEKWCSISDKIRFFLVGGFNTCFSYIIFVIALHLLGEPYYQICAALQWIIGSFFSYTTQKIFVFCTKGNYIREYFKCCASWVISYTVNALLLEFFVKFVRFNVYFAQIISVLFASVVTYLLLKHFAFKKTAN